MELTSRPSVWSVYLLISFYLAGSAVGNTLITRPGVNRQQCAQACLDERDIDCRWYKFDKVKEVCILSAEPDPTVPNMKQLDKPDPGPIKTVASSWIEQLQARLLALEQKNIDIKNLHRETAELRAEIAALKNSRALTHHLLRTTKEQTDQNIAAEDEKTEVLKAETKRVEDAIMTLGEMQKSFSDKVRKINDAEKATDLKVAMLSQSAKDTRASVRELSTEESDVKSGLMNVKRLEAELEVRFAGLSSDVMEKVSSIDSMVGPELKEMRDSQATLAEALSQLTKKIMTLAPRIPALQKQINKKEGMLAVVTRKMQSFDSQVDFLNDRLRFTEKQIRKVIDPGFLVLKEFNLLIIDTHHSLMRLKESKLNVENRRVMTYLRGVVASLQENQKRIENDVLVEISDRSHLYKELASLKVSRKALVDKVVSLEMAIRNFRTSIRKLAIEGPKGRMVTNLLNRQVNALRSLKKLRDTQTEIQNALVKYKLTMMKTHEELLERDRKRVLNEVALRKLQSRLLEVYRKMEGSLAGSISSRDMMTLLKQQKDTLVKMSLLQKLQQDLQQEVAQFRQAKNDELRQLEEQRQQQQRDLRQLQEIKQQTVNLYNNLETKMQKDDASSRLEDITKTQDSLVKTLTDYKSALAKTQAELQSQRTNQAASTSKLRQELKDLHRSLTSVIGEPSEKALVPDTESDN